MEYISYFISSELGLENIWKSLNEENIFHIVRGFNPLEKLKISQEIFFQ